MKEDKNLDKYVEDKIKRFNFVAKNFTKEDMDFVDNYCKKNYDNNRKLMILDLINYKEQNLPLVLTNEKINFIYNDLLEKISALKKEKEEETKPKKITWKGFSSE